MTKMRRTASAATLLVAALALAGCSAARTQNIQTAAAPEQLAPVQSSSIASGNLPPLAGAATTEQLAPGLSGTPVLGGVQPPATTQPNGAVATLNNAAPGAAPAVGARDLSGGLTVEKLLGGWTVAGGGTECRLNLTQTLKDGTSRYRASAPGCQIAVLAGVASWSLVGNGVQLYDEGGSLIAVLQLSGNRFIGTVSGGTAVTMSA